MAPTSRYSYTQEQLLAAIQSVRDGKISINGASKAFRIPYATLGDKLRGRRPINPQPRTLLSQKEEERLVHWLKESARQGFGKSKSEIKEAVKAMLDVSGAKTRCPENRPGRQWFEAFFKRHPDLDNKKPSPQDKERDLVFQRTLSACFADMKTLIDSQDSTLLQSPNRLYNANETGFGLCPSAKKIIAVKGSKHDYSLSSNTRRNITVMACCSANGDYLPPLIIFPYKRMPTHNLLEGFEEAFFQISSDGLVNSTIFLAWLRDCFIPAVSEIQKPLVLFVDSHSSHTSSMDVSDICRENGIILYCLRSCASHIIQPLDQDLLGAVKFAWESEAKKHILCAGEIVSVKTFASVLKPVWEATTTSEIAINGFSKSGIFPFNPAKALTSNKLLPNFIFQEKVEPPESGSSHDLMANASTNQTSLRVNDNLVSVSTRESQDFMIDASPFENIKKLLQFTAGLGTQKFENLWKIYFNESTDSDLQFDEFKQLLDDVIRSSDTQEKHSAPTKSSIRGCNTDATINKTSPLPLVQKNKSATRQSAGKSMPMAISGTLFKSNLAQNLTEKTDKIEKAKEEGLKMAEEYKQRKLKEKEEREKIAEEKRQRRKEENEEREKIAEEKRRRRKEEKEVLKKKVNLAIFKKILYEMEKKERDEESQSDNNSDDEMKGI